MLLLLGSCTGCRKTPAPREYSADLTVTDSSSGTSAKWGRPDVYRAKVHVTRENVRIEFERSQSTKMRVTYPGKGEIEEEIPAQFKGPFWGSGKYVIMNYADQSGWVVTPADGTCSRFLDEPYAVERLLLTEVLFSLRPAVKPGNDASPCPQNAEFPCTRVGTEKLNGREAVKWETRMVRRNSYVAQIVPRHLWVDRDLGILLKLSEPDSQVEKASGRELAHFKQDKQDNSLFQLPAGCGPK